MNKKLIVLSLLISLSFLSFSQQIIKGKIINTENGKAVSYVNIGIKGSSIGTVSNLDGSFLIAIPKSYQIDNTTCIISCIGYTEQSILIDTLREENITLKLVPSTRVLNDVVINSRQKKGKKDDNPRLKKLGKIHTFLPIMHSMFYTASDSVIEDRLGRERGTIITIKEDCNVKAFSFHISGNEFKTIRFRLNLYATAKGKPSDLINQQDILFEVKDGFKGWYTVDLSQYSIVLKKNLEKAFVSLQWIDSEKLEDDSKWFSISAALSSVKNHFYRNKIGSLLMES
ncbi:carboxypeptidase-like regulatory domain-containing protein [Flammeovirga pectinis]|uniref:Carboxypeptidase-like regulatory domain-containing protein n=1 Tax=Flammeovirga pectinis TaxID=2494373 RepID=A0A3Q9FR37_9BACT|nr:carboxypeptidase-like regulatory domain-containing protein [Flammeovirga pectinis]AZQ64029.1 carboxypeptidase-like regulatory domain-containing protein [Flammeovirga pectinis]